SALASRIVVADPDRNRDVVGETHEPCIVLVVGSARLAGNVWRETGDGTCSPTRQHPLHHGLELIKRGTIDRLDWDRSRLMPKNGFAVALDRFDRIGNRAHPFIGYGSIKRCEVDGAYRLGPQHEWIMPQALAVDLRLNGKLAKPVEACLRLVGDAPVKEMHRREIARVLKRAAQREDTASPTIVVFRCPVILLAHATPADGANGR